MASEHTAQVQWLRNGQVFTDMKFSRKCEIRFDGGVRIPGSSAPSSVPVPYSDESAVDPEELLVSALATCHMMWFLYLASKDEYLVDSYADSPIGYMEEVAKGIRGITKITIRPEITFSGDTVPSPEKIMELHHKAHEYCNIANSISAKVGIEPR